MAPPAASLLYIGELSLADLQQLVRQSAGAAYAILDACDEPRVPEKVGELGNERAVSLYRGAAERDYAAIAPYLVQLDESLLEWIVESLWQEPWGFIAFARTDLYCIRKHFRKFLTVEDPEGNNMYFRFYDPRVLGQFLQTCTEQELRQFFGSIDQFVLCEMPATPQRFRLAEHSGARVR